MDKKGKPQLLHSINYIITNIKWCMMEDIFVTIFILGNIKIYKLYPG